MPNIVLMILINIIKKRKEWLFYKLKMKKNQKILKFNR